MKEQAGLYQEMSVVLQGMTEKGNVEEGAEKLTDLVSAIQSNRAQTAALPKINEEDQLRLAQLPDLATGHKAFFDARRAFLNSQYSFPQIDNVFSGLQESQPVVGEGRSQ